MLIFDPAATVIRRHDGATVEVSLFAEASIALDGDALVVLATDDRGDDVEIRLSIATTEEAAALRAVLAGELDEAAA